MEITENEKWHLRLLNFEVMTFGSVSNFLVSTVVIINGVYTKIFSVPQTQVGFFVVFIL